MNGSAPSREPRRGKKDKEKEALVAAVREVLAVFTAAGVAGGTGTVLNAVLVPSTAFCPQMRSPQR